MNKIGLAKFGFFRTPLAVSLPLILATSAFAQDPSPSPDETTPAVRAFNAQGTEEAATERIIVTGSNIPTAEEVGPNPVMNLNRDMITKSGERNTEELLRNLPIANANGVPVSNNENGSNTRSAGPRSRCVVLTPERPLSCSMDDASRLIPWNNGGRRRLLWI